MKQTTNPKFSNMNSGEWMENLFLNFGMSVFLLLHCKYSHQIVNVLYFQIKAVGLRTFTIIIRWFMAFTQGKWSTSVIHLSRDRFFKFTLTLIFNSLTSCVFLCSFYSMYCSLLFLFPFIIFISFSLRPCPSRLLSHTYCSICHHQ